MTSKDKIAAWSSYWAEGNATSIPNLFPHNYGGGISEFWYDTFGMLKANNRLLDICTGNGALALLARNHLDRRNIRCEIDAIDVARIQPQEPASPDTTLSEIRFHSGVALEATKFPDHCFDLVVGQFALEYCRAEDAIQELSRITRQDGAVVVMMHHADSITVRKTEELMEIAECFLKRPTILFRLRQYAEEYSRHNGRETPKLIRKRQNLIASFSSANDLLRQFPNDRFLRLTLHNIKYLFSQVHRDPAIGIKRIQDFEKIIKHHMTRMRDHRDAAVDGKKAEALRSLFHRYEFPFVECQPYYLDGELFSWTLKARGDRGRLKHSSQLRDDLAR